MALLLGQFPGRRKLPVPRETRSNAVRRESHAFILGIQKGQGEGKRGKFKASPQLRVRQANHYRHFDHKLHAHPSLFGRGKSEKHSGRNKQMPRHVPFRIH
ncbi:hypothetical protein NGR_c19490 [Sinorhizobium fredii NGR234]|uniref:Uncharacterized protein n=1 Tax=Sinorhizobium fredii (strain NBRC 101917 / NGR234) TaxID=394 RepID=C3ME43_SINFN|nr:hypothetical protein NGR_c19490 [Sinorhizobium fredii NGR234]